MFAEARELAHHGAMTTETEERNIPVDTLELRLVIARMHAGGITAKEAAMRVGVSGQTWRNWEDGDSAGARKPAMLHFIAQQLDVDETWLREGGPLARSRPLPDGPGTGESPPSVPKVDSLRLVA